VLRLALHKIKVNRLSQEKVRQEEIITDIKSWLGREGGILTQVLIEIYGMNDISMKAYLMFCHFIYV
jgi:hypothetical protein